MRANVDRLGNDADKIAVSRNSAGGHLSHIVAATANLPEFEGEGGNPGLPTDVGACVAVYPPTSMMRMREGAPLTGAVGQLMGPNADDAAYKGANPLTYARAEFPPTMLLHGNKDTTVPVSESFKMYEALIGAGVQTEMHIFAGQPHAFDAAPDYGRAAASLIDLFLKRNLLGIAPMAVGGNGARRA
jgi:acetyl esterase/lipase